MKYDITLRNLESAFVKKDKCFYHNAIEISMFTKIIDEQIYLINEKEFIDQIVEYAKTNFVCKDTNYMCLFDEDDPTKFFYVDTYGLVASCSEELILRYKQQNIDIVNGLRIYVLMSLFKTLIEFRSRGYTRLWWNMKPQTLIEEPYFKCIFNILGRMRIAVAK